MSEYLPPPPPPPPPPPSDPNPPPSPAPLPTEARSWWKDWLPWVSVLILFVGVRAAVENYRDPVTGEFDASGQEVAFGLDLALPFVIVGVLVGVVLTRRARGRSWAWWRPAVIGLAALVAVGVTAGLVAGGDDEPSEGEALTTFRAQMVAACIEASIPSSECECATDWLFEQYTFDELEEAASTDTGASAVMALAFRSCGVGAP